MHSRPHAKVTQQVTWYIPSPHSETNVTTKQRPFSVLAGPSQENRLTQSNVPPWFGTQQEARIRPLPKRSQQKKNEPVQFFQRSLQEVEAHGPSGQSRPLPGITQFHERSRKTPLSTTTFLELPSSSRSPLTASSSTPMKSKALERGAPDGQSVKSGQREEQGYSLKEQGTPRFPEIKDLLSHYSSFDLPTHDLKLTVAATYR